MAAEERWYFTKEQLMNTPSRKCGIDADKELSYRQQAANFIQDMGQRLQVNQLCINTAIVYVHRFYMFHSFTRFHRNAIATCALFLAAKVEEQPRKLEHVIKVAHMCLHRDAPPLDSKSEAYMEQCHELISNENIMLQTLGFDVAIDHPHTHVVKCCQLVRGGGSSLHQHHASKDLAQTSYFMSTNSLHLTTMCLQYKPTVVACVCIHLACKWANWQIPRSSEGKDWYWYVDKTVGLELLEDLTAEFLVIMDRCPSRLKRKMMMNDKIQDTATVEKKLAAELAQASNRQLALTSKTDRERQDRHHEHNPGAVPRQVPSSKGAGMSDHVNSHSDAAGNKNDTPKAEPREHGGVNSEPANTNPPPVSTANMMASLKSLVVVPATPTPPYVNDHSPAQMLSSRITSSIDQGYSSMSYNSQSSQLDPPALSCLPPSLLATPPKKPVKLESSGSGSSGGGGSSSTGRGITPKEYRERKKRERAEQKEKSRAASTRQPPPPHDGGQVDAAGDPSDQHKRQRTLSSSSSGSTGSLSALSTARHMQPVVALTSLNLSVLAKTPASKQPASSKHHHLTTPEKQRAHEDSEGGPSAARDVLRLSSNNNDDSGSSTSSLHVINAIRRLDIRGAEDLEENVPALVRPPILTPSPPLAAGEVSKPDILAERPTTLSFPLEDVASGEEHHRLLIGSSSVPPPPPPPSAFGDHLIARTEVHAKDKDAGRGHHNLVPPPRASNYPDAATSARRHEVGAPKERPTKQRKSKTPPSAKQIPFAAMSSAVLPQHAEVSRGNGVASPPPPPPPIVPHADEHQQHPPLAALRNSVPAEVTPPFQVITRPEARTSSFQVQQQQQHLAAAAATATMVQWGTASGGEFVAARSGMVLPVAQERVQAAAAAPPPPVPHQTLEATMTAAAPALENRGKVKSPRPPQLPHAVVASPILAAAASMLNPVPSHHEAAPRTKDKHPVGVPPPQQQQPSKHHERREKHKHKERSRDRGVIATTIAPVPRAEPPPPPSPAPAIKLTIPKERLNLGTVEGAVGGRGLAATAAAPSSSSKESSGLGSLKIKIPKEKISGAKLSKVVSLSDPAAPASSSHASLAVAPPVPTGDKPPHKEGGGGGGLKIKITKDRLGSKSSFNWSLGGSSSSTDFAKSSEKDSRKRERPPSPPKLQPVGGDVGYSATEPKPPKVMKVSVRAARKSESPRAATVPVTSAYDVPPSSNTRSSSSSKQDVLPQHNVAYNKQHSGRGHNNKGGGKHRGGGRGANMGPMHVLYGHQVTLNAGPYPYQQYFPYAPQPNFYNHPMGPPPHPPPHGPMPPPPSSHHGHPADYPPPPPFFGQPPFRPPSYATPPPPLLRRPMPPLPSEPPPAIPPPPPE